MMPDMPMPLPPGPRPVVAMLVYPRMVLLDLVGPLTVFRILRADVDLYWHDTSPLTTDAGLPVSATRTLDQCPAVPDVLFVPGGLMGTLDVMNDAVSTAWLADRSGRARWVTSDCTGSLALAAAGLLTGRRATSHWGVADVVPLMGATYVEGQRVVRNGNRLTASGVTAGIDLALQLVTLLKGEAEARRIQLIMEYSPQPPYRNGTPAKAGPARTAAARGRRKWMDAHAHMAAEAAKAAGKRLGIGA